MYGEVAMIEFREVLRLWQEQVPKKRIGALLGLDPKTVRRYLRAAEASKTYLAHGKVDFFAEEEMAHSGGAGGPFGTMQSADSV
jgi:hypothetical protein